MIFWGREHSLSLESECELLKSLGFGIELWPNIKGRHECRYEKRNWHRLAAATEGMLVVMRSRQDGPTLAQWKEQIDCAEFLDANIVADLKSIGIPNEPELNGCDFADEVIRLAAEKEVTLCLEAGPLATLKEVGKRFDSIRYCLDTSHAYKNGESSFKQYVDDLGPGVIHLHLNDHFNGYSKLDTQYQSLDARENRGTGIENPQSRFGNDAYQGLCRFWCGGGIPLEEWEYLLENLKKYDNDIVGSIEMSPCQPAVMIRQASEFLFDTLKWPNQPEKSSHADVGYHPM
jgi:sugar phosphate isomerase/epimerase